METRFTPQERSLMRILFLYYFSSGLVQVFLHVFFLGLGGLKSVILFGLVGGAAVIMLALASARKRRS